MRRHIQESVYDIGRHEFQMNAILRSAQKSAVGSRFMTVKRMIWLNMIVVMAA